MDVIYGDVVVQKDGDQVFGSSWTTFPTQLLCMEAGR
jgi:hypothetical protein